MDATKILSAAVAGSDGIEATASVLTKLSTYIAQQGCTPSVQQIISDVVMQYGGSTTAFVSALRGLDIETTDVAALGACLPQAMAVEKKGP